jgi:hypothetical protein
LVRAVDAGHGRLPRNIEVGLSLDQPSVLGRTPVGLAGCLECLDTVPNIFGHREGTSQEVPYESIG